VSKSHDSDPSNTRPEVEPTGNGSDPRSDPQGQRRLTDKAMARPAASGWLTDVQVRSLAQHPGKHRVGPKTMLVCDCTGRGAFEFRYIRNGRTRSMGLCDWPAVGLAELRI